MEHTEKSKTVLGQAPNLQEKPGLLKKTRQHLFDVQKKRMEKQEAQALFATLKDALHTRDAFRQTLQYVTEADCAEICIYRLKAAELDFNRHIRLAKTARLSAVSYPEEWL